MTKHIPESVGVMIEEFNATIRSYPTQAVAIVLAMFAFGALVTIAVLVHKFSDPVETHRFAKAVTVFK